MVKWRETRHDRRRAVYPLHQEQDTKKQDSNWWNYWTGHGGHCVWSEFKYCCFTTNSVFYDSSIIYKCKLKKHRGGGSGEVLHTMWAGVEHQMMLRINLSLYQLHYEEIGITWNYLFFFRPIGLINFIPNPDGIMHLDRAHLWRSRSCDCVNWWPTCRTEHSDMWKA